MGALTIHFDDAARRSRRRSRGPVAAALLGGVVLGTLAGKTPPPPPRIIEKPVIVTQTIAVPAPVPAPVPVAQPVVPPPAPVRKIAKPAPRPAPLTPIRPVLEPANIVFTAPGSKMVRVTNPHDRPITIHRLFVTRGGGYEVDASQCNGQTLVARGGSCTILISASPEAVQSGARLDLRMSHDSGMGRTAN